MSSKEAAVPGNKNALFNAGYKIKECLMSAPERRPGEGRGPVCRTHGLYGSSRIVKLYWIPAFAGTTK